MAARFLLAATLAASALAAPVIEDRQNCAAAYGQCGGTGFTGSTCCASGATCVVVNSYYSQCQSGGSGAGAGASTPTSTTGSGSGSAATVAVAPATTASGTLSYSGNPFSGVQLWANAYYASEVSSLAIPSLSAAQATAAAAVAKVPSFVWLDTANKVGTVMASTLADISAANKAGASPAWAGQFVVYDLPDRDCAAAASNGEYSIANGGVANYKAYIDSIRALLVQYSNVRTILVVEPDSLANLVTNLNVAKCANAEAAYKQCVTYAIQQLNLPNVAMYLDAGHAGWLGWTANLQPAATLFAAIYSGAGSPASVRGLATNVANYNGWSLSTAPSYTSGDSNYDEIHYVQALSPLVNAAGFPAHFITDTSRNGKQPTGQIAWGDWCNVIGTGFGVRPTSSTGLAIEDAFVWVKPGGECDGTSNTSATRYDFHCGLSDALQPSPEAGTWFQAYFVQLLTNANPAF